MLTTSLLSTPKTHGKNSTLRYMSKAYKARETPTRTVTPASPSSPMQRNFSGKTLLSANICVYPCLFANNLRLNKVVRELHEEHGLQFKCDCDIWKRMETCKHCLAWMHLDKDIKFDAKALLARSDRSKQKKFNGRPPKVPTALNEDDI